MFSGLVRSGLPLLPASPPALLPAPCGALSTALLPFYYATCRWRSFCRLTMLLLLRNRYALRALRIADYLTPSLCLAHATCLVNNTARHDLRAAQFVVDYWPSALSLSYAALLLALFSTALSCI